jgi:putative hydrolase of the HAD superfamily
VAARPGSGSTTSGRSRVVFPEAGSCLRAVADAGGRNVILSNHVPELARLVADLGLAEHVQRIFTSAVVGWEKPNRVFFEHALAAMGHPARTWMVGDNPLADVAGAEAVGIPAILIHAADAPTSLRQATDSILAVF